MDAAAAKIQLESYNDLQFLRKTIADHLKTTAAVLAGVETVDAATAADLERVRYWQGRQLPVILQRLTPP